MPELSPDIERELEALDDALAGRPVAPDLADLGELALLLRDERPQPDEGFARFLDTRAARGFPGRDPRTRASGRRWFAWQGWMAPAMGVAATGLVIAVIAGSGLWGGDGDAGGGGGSTTAMSQPEQNGASGGAGAPVPESADSARSADAGAEADASGGDEATTLAVPESIPPAPTTGSPRTDGRDARKVERSAALTLATRPRSIDAVSARVQEVTRQQGGFVVTSTVSSSARGGGGTFELRIPARNLDAAMAALSRLGAVRERSQHAQDITAQSVSARSRLRDAKAERESLLKQLAAAVTLQETDSVRARLRLVSAEIERARAEVRRVGNRATFSTVSVTLVADRSAVAPGAEDDGSWTPGDAADDALRVLEVVAGIALIALAIALPLALLALLAGLALRFGRRRGREHALDVV